MKYDNDTAFFIDGKGKPSIGNKTQPLDMSDFCMLVGIPSCTTVIGRRMFSQTLRKQNSIVLQQSEEYAL